MATSPRPQSIFQSIGTPTKRRRCTLPRKENGVSTPSNNEAFAVVGAGAAEGPRCESVEAIRQAAKPQRVPTVKGPGEEADTLPFRPVRRPPMAALCILFDGREDGEWVSIRSERCVIGRAEGDL